MKNVDSENKRNILEASGMNSGHSDSFWEEQTSQPRASTDSLCPPLSGFRVELLPMGACFLPALPSVGISISMFRTQVGCEFSSFHTHSHLSGAQHSSAKSRPQITPGAARLWASSKGAGMEDCALVDHTAEHALMRLLLLFNILVSPRN